MALVLPLHFNFPAAKYLFQRDSKRSSLYQCWKDSEYFSIHGTSICRYKFQSDFDQQEKNKISCLKIVLKFFLWSVVILMNRAVLLTLVVNDIQPSAYRVFIHAPWWVHFHGWYHVPSNITKYFFYYYLSNTFFYSKRTFAAGYSITLRRGDTTQ